MLGNTARGEEREIAIDLANLVMGLSLAAAPWMLGFSAYEPAALSAVFIGDAIAIVAVLALVSFAAWQEWLNLCLGISAGVAPWIAGFSETTNATYGHVLVGVIVAAMAALDLTMLYLRPAPMD